jgi:hypothetical protein
MTTLATTSLKWLANEWEKVYKSAVLSGIVGDLAHKKRGGYHISREDQGSGNYSVTRPDDRPGNGPSDRAAAIDMTMNTADMIKCHVRLRESWKNRAKDSRWKYINAWNGWDGKGDAGRYDVVTGNVGTATADHKWHIHLEIRRKYVNDMNAMKAILSLIKGEPLTGTSPSKAPIQEGDEDMALDAADINKIVAGVWNYRLQNAYNGTEQTAGTILRYAPSRSPHDVTQELVNKALTALAAIGERVDLDPAEIEAIKAVVPSSEENANAVLAAFGQSGVPTLAEALRDVLTPEQLAELRSTL